MPDFSKVLSDAIKSNDLEKILDLKRLHAAYFFISPSSKDNPQASLHTVNENIRRGLNIASDNNRLDTLDTLPTPEDLFTQTFVTPLQNIEKSIPAPSTPIAHANNSIRGFESILRLSLFAREENKNIHSMIDLVFNLMTLIGSVLFFVSTVATLPVSAPAVAVIANLANFARNVIGMGKSLFRLIRTNNMETAQASAKTLIDTSLRIALFIGSALLLSTGPVGIIIGITLLTLLIIPDIRNFLISMPYTRNFISWAEKAISNFIKDSPLQLFSSLIQTVALGAELIQQKLVKELVSVKLKFVLKKEKITFDEIPKKNFFELYSEVKEKIEQKKKKHKK